MQAEAVLQIIRAKGDEAADLLQALADSYQTGRRIAQGAQVVPAGRPNVGKSSFLNVLLGEERSLATTDVLQSGDQGDRQGAPRTRDRRPRGEMAKAIDRAGIQFKMLNMSKGPAVRALRAQADRDLYREVMTEALLSQPRLFVAD